MEDNAVTQEVSEMEVSEMRVSELDAQSPAEASEGPELKGSAHKRKIDRERKQRQREREREAENRLWNSPVELSENDAREILTSRQIKGNVQNQIIRFDDPVWKRLSLTPNYFYWAHGPLLQIFERRCAGEPGNEVSEAIICQQVMNEWQIPKTAPFQNQLDLLNYVRLLLWRNHWRGVVESRRNHGDLTPPLDQLQAEIEALMAEHGPIKIADVKDVATGGLRYKSEVLSFDELCALWEYTAMSYAIKLDGDPVKPHPSDLEGNATMKPLLSDQPKRSILSASSILS